MNCLYQITNILNNKIYIGVHTTDSLDDGYMGSGTAIKRAIKKYGIENFKKDILEFFNTYEEALLAEEQIVDNDFILREDTYNLRCGGIGGFEHINNVPPEDRKNFKILKQKIASGEIKCGGSKHWTEEGRAKVINIAKENQIKATEKAKSPEAKIKRKEKYVEIKHQQGNNNSQFGKYWISNITTKEVKRINKDDKIPDGWVKGKRGHKVLTCWVNNEKKEYLILLIDKEKYLEQGYIGGRLKSSIPKRIVV